MFKFLMSLSNRLFSAFSVAKPISKRGREILRSDSEAGDKIVNFMINNKKSDTLTIGNKKFIVHK